jgi:hypothetical protein
MKLWNDIDKLETKQQNLHERGRGDMGVLPLKWLFVEEGKGLLGIRNCGYISRISCASRDRGPVTLHDVFWQGWIKNVSFSGSATKRKLYYLSQNINRSPTLMWNVASL